LFTETRRRWGKWLAAHTDRGNSPVLIGKKAGWAQDSVNTPVNKMPGRQQ